MTYTFKRDQGEVTNPSRPCTDCWNLKLPIELWEQIIEEAWKAPMSIPDRSQFKFAVEKASPILLDILAKVTDRDVYVPWPNHLNPCNSVYAASRSAWPTRSRPIHRFELCHSLTKQIMLSDMSSDALQYRMSQLHNLRGRPIRDILFSFRGLPFLPNLQRFCIQYHAPYSARHMYSLSPVYHQFDVVRLTVKINRITPWMLDLISNTHITPEDDFLLVRQPYVEFISAASDEMVNRILYVCPHLELAEDTMDIEMRILESSTALDDSCTLIHGPIHCYNSWDATNGQTGPTSKRFALSVRGTCLALVLPADIIQARKDIAKVGSRKPYIFVRR